MKGKIHVFVLVFCVFLCAQAYGQTSSPIDLVLLLDTSSGMSSSYDNVNNYISGPFLNEYLRVGDTFHLISFSSNPRLDAARRISGIGDVETIIGRMFLQYPVERGANIGAAISYAEQYIISLPNRPKKIVLVSTGSNDTNNLVTSAKSRLSSKNATLDYVQVTPGQALANLPKSGRPPAEGKITPQVSGGGQTPPGTGQQVTTVKPPANDGPGQTQGWVDGTDNNKLKGGGTPGEGMAYPWSDDGKKETVVPGTNDPWKDDPGGAKTTDSQGDEKNRITTEEGSGGTKETDRPGTSSENKYPDTQKTREASSINWSENLPLIIGIILGLLLLLALILFLSSRRLGSSPNRAMAQASSPSSSASSAYRSEERFADHSKDLNSFAASSGRRSTPYENKNYKAPVINPTGPLLLNLYVEDQNTAIGKRNIHSLKSGFGFSVGGGKHDDFLIFLVPMPAGIGEIRRDGSTLTFTPKKPKYFPEIGSTPVRDCINKTITIKSDKNYEMRFRFEMYEDPLIALNRVLMQVKVPGLV